MADKPTDPTKPTTYSFDIAAFKAKDVALLKARDAAAGKPNYNPFVWYAKVAQPLIERFKAGEQTKELFDALMAVPETVPCLDPNWVAPKPEAIRPPVPLK